MNIPSAGEYRRLEAQAKARKAADDARKAADDARQRAVAEQRRASQVQRTMPAVYATAASEVERSLSADPTNHVIRTSLNTDRLGLDLCRPVLEQIAQEFKDKGYTDAGWGAGSNGDVYIYYSP